MEAKPMDRYCLLTWTTYGTWLPGDERGFVGRVREGCGARVEHDLPGTEYAADLPGLEQASREWMKGPPLYLEPPDAEPLLGQFKQTAQYRGWALLAGAIMRNHVHLVVAVPGDPDPANLLRDFKSYGSRPLTRRRGRPTSETWWTQSGSRRKLPDVEAVTRAIEYARNQPHTLIVFVAESVSEPASGGG
jgi:REP element-mobilizing transposase RayT